MRGVILAGGTGSRLHPLTRITNKHLLPIGDRPMISYGIEALVKAGVTEIMVVTGGTHAGEFLRLLSNGQEFGVERLLYAYQERAGGIAEALGPREHNSSATTPPSSCWPTTSSAVLLLPPWTVSHKSRKVPAIVLAEVKDPDHLRHLGVPAIDESGRIVRIVEKPEDPPSAYCVTGVYLYDSGLRHHPHPRPSGRGELEITDVNNHYVAEGLVTTTCSEGFWGDAGESIDAYYAVNDHVRRYGANLD